MTTLKEITLHSVIEEIQKEQKCGGYTLEVALNSYVLNAMVVQDKTKDSQRKDRAEQRGLLAVLYKGMLEIGRN